MFLLMEVRVLKVSIITATWNSEATVADTIASVASQKYEDIEYIIIDGGSKDNTISLINRSGYQPDTFVSEKDSGIYDALNKGISFATGEVVGFLHSDDVYSHDLVISRVADAFCDSSIEAVYGNLEYVSKVDVSRRIRRWTSHACREENLRNGWMPPHPTFFMRKKNYERYGGFDLRYSISADYESMLRYLLFHRLNAHFIDEYFVKMRVGGLSNRNIGNVLRKTFEDMAIMRAYGMQVLPSILRKNISKIPQFFNN